MKTAKPRITSLQTQIRVLEEAVRFMRPRARFTPDSYLLMDEGSYGGVQPGPDVGVACLVGGVEQAVWLATGRNVEEGVGEWLSTLRARDRAFSSRGDHVLFAKVMTRVNRAARELYPTVPERRRSIVTAEQITLEVSAATGHRRTMRVLREALREAREEAS